MKIFKKILAVFLAAVMLLSLFPLSVFADPSSGTVVQGEKGNGNDGTVTITIGRSQLSELMQSLGEGGFSGLPEGMIEYDREILTVDEMIEFIDIDAFLDLILGEHYEHLPQLLKNLSDGDMKNLMKLIDDLNELIASADFDALADFVSAIDGIIDILYIDALRDYFKSKPLSEVIELFGSNYESFITDLATKLNNKELKKNNGEVLTIDDLVDFFAMDPNDFSDEMRENAAKLTRALSDMIQAGLDIPECYEVHESTLFNNDVIKEGILDLLKNNDTTQILTPTGIGVAAKLAVRRFAENQIDLSDYVTEANLQRLFNENPAVKSAIVNRINNGTIDGNELLTDDGRAALAAWRYENGRNPADPTLTDADFDFIRGNADYYNLSAVLSATADVVIDLGTNVASYLNDDFLSTASDLFTIEDIGVIFKENEGNYNAWNLFREILDLVNENGLDLDEFVEVDISDLLADDDIVAFFKEHVTDWFLPSEIISILSDRLNTYLKSDFYSHTSLIRFAKDYVNIGATLRKILNDHRRLEEFVDIDAMLELDLDYGALFDLFSRAELVNQLKDNIKEIFEALTDEQRKDVIVFLITSVLEQFQKVTLDGYTIAANNGRVLAIDPNALITAVWEAIPKFDELASPDFNGTLLSFNTTLDYQNADGTPVHKDINIIVRTTSGISVIRRVAALLDRYLSITLENNRFRIQINTPAVLADYYRKTLEYGSESEAINGLRQKLLAMEGMTGADLINAFADIPLSEIVAALDDADVNEIYTRMIHAGYVQRVLEKLEEIAGVRYDLSRIDTLDELLDLIRNGSLPTVETIVRKISEKLKVDLMAVLETVARSTDENEYVQNLLEKAGSLPGIGQFTEGLSAVEVLEDYKGLDPITAVAAFISDRIGSDLVARLYADNTAEELYRSVLNFVDTRLSDSYAKFQTLLVNLADPDYEPTEKSLQLLQSLIPQKALSAFLDHSLTDIYCGESLFSAEEEGVGVKLDSVSSAVIRLIGHWVGINDDLNETLRAFLPSGTIRFDLSVRFTFTNVYQVNYYDSDGQKCVTTFLPEGIDPSVIDVPAKEGKTVVGWTDAPESGSLVGAVRGDVDLYPSYEDITYNVRFRFYDSLTQTYTETEIPVVWNTKISADAIPDQVPTGIDGTDCHRVYYRGDSAGGTVIARSEIADTTVTEDGLVFTVGYYPIERVNVIFKFYDGTGYTDLGAVAVETNTCLAADQIPTVAIPENVVAGSALVYFAGSTLDPAKIVNDPTADPVAEETVYTLAYLPVGLLDGGESSVYLTTDEAGNWTARVVDATDFDLIFDATDPAFDGATSITVQSDTVEITVSSALLATVKAQTPLSNLRLSARKYATAKTFTLSSNIYRATSNEAYDLELLLNADGSDPGSGTRLNAFDGGLTVTIKPSEENLTVLAAGSQTQRTAVYIVEGETIVEDLAVTPSVADQTVTFYPPHFTDVVIVNEYLLTPEFVGSVSAGTFLLNGTEIEADGVLIPAGATLIKPSASVSSPTLNRVGSISIDGSEITLGNNFSPMPSNETTATVTTVAIVFRAWYRMPDGSLFDNQADAEAWLIAHPDSAPTGYEFTKNESGNYVFSNENVDPNTVKADVYRTPVPTPISYTLVFRPGHGAADIVASFTILDAQNRTFLAPALPEIAGYASVGWSAYDLNAVIADPAENTVNGIYLARLYTVTYADGSTDAFHAGETVDATVGYSAPAGYEIASVSYLVENSVTTLPSGTSTFVMPVGNVRVAIAVRPVTVEVVINGTAVELPLGDVYTFEIVLSANEFLAEGPAGARLISSETKPDGSRVLVYAAEVAETTADLSYRVEKRQLAQNRVTNGLIGEENAPNVRYNATSDTSFRSAVYSFAVYERQERALWLLLLWILLIVILVVAIIVMLYLIIIRAGLGPNIFTRVICAIVHAFLKACVGVYALFGGLFKKKQK